MKKLFKHIVFSGVLAFMVILPSTGFSNSNKAYFPKFMENKLKRKKLDINEAIDLVLLNNAGIVNKTHTILNPKDEEVHFVNVVNDKFVKLYMVEQDGNLDLIEEMPIQNIS